ncbi:MAG: hypothetical protein KGJ79_14130 [Alphaproteobacteria bacterium]|nr:hypothetical protein [Alphaproteobacteria bacterium]MDE2494404.1 hypothetical protein [Alphaproteobacteria bacterium]
MAKKAKKSMPRSGAAKRKSKAKVAKPPRAKRPVPRKKTVKRQAKHETTLEKIENAILVGAAELDNMAVGLGLLAASPPPKKRNKKR